MKEFLISKHITLKLENGKTNIYIGGNLTRQCKKLILQIPNKEDSLLNDINSIDESIPLLDKSLQSIEIPSELEFWGHCSNIQAWAENGYAASLLPSNLSFALLKPLSKLGDTNALNVLKEETGKIVLDADMSLIRRMIGRRSLTYFNAEELYTIYQNRKTIRKNAKKRELETDWGGLELLKYLEFVGGKVYEGILRKKILQVVRRGNLKDIRWLYHGGFLDYLTGSETREAFVKIHLLEKLLEELKEEKKTAASSSTAWAALISTKTPWLSYDSAIHKLENLLDQVKGKEEKTAALSSTEKAALSSIKPFWQDYHSVLLKLEASGCYKAAIDHLANKRFVILQDFNSEFFLKLRTS